jgi:hypothetical protein
MSRRGRSATAEKETESSENYRDRRRQGCRRQAYTDVFTVPTTFPQFSLARTLKRKTLNRGRIYGTVASKDAGVEPTRMYSRRVPKIFPRFSLARTLR